MSKTFPRVSQQRKAIKIGQALAGRGSRAAGLGLSGGGKIRSRNDRRPWS